MSAGPVETAALERSLSAVLADLTFPAHRWQIIVTAEQYGADARTVTALRNLSAPGYHGVRPLAAELTARHLGLPGERGVPSEVARPGPS